MEFVYRFLGLIAGWNEGLSRHRINLIPWNWIAMFGLAALCMTSLACIQQGMTMNHTPIKTSVHELLTKPTMKDKYVTVSGELEPDIAYQYGKKRASGEFEVENTWMLMTQPNTPEGVFVEVPNEYYDDKKPRQATLTGTWVSIDDHLAPEIAKENFKKEGLTVDSADMLNAGASPPEPAVWAVTLVLSGALFLAFLVSFLRQYVIFQVKPNSGFSSLDLSGVSLPALIRVTGEFALEMRDRKRFLNVPTHPTMLENGHFALLSNIDASSRFFGIRTNNRSGVWLVAVSPASVRDLTRGTFYLGGGAAHAVRFRYEDGVNSSTKTAILSFATLGEREVVLAELERMSTPTAAY
jgi:hypothetical protein